MTFNCSMQPFHKPAKHPWLDFWRNAKKGKTVKKKKRKF